MRYSYIVSNAEKLYTGFSTILELSQNLLHWSYDIDLAPTETPIVDMAIFENICCYITIFE